MVFDGDTRRRRSGVFASHKRQMARSPVVSVLPSRPFRPLGKVANLTDDVKMLRSIVMETIIRCDKCWERRYRDGQSVPNEAGCFGGMCSEEVANG